MRGQESAKVDASSYDKALDDADAALANIVASVHGPMPEATWLSTARATIAALKMTPEDNVTAEQEKRLAAMEEQVKALTATVAGMKTALESRDSPVRRQMGDVPALESTKEA